MKESDRNEYCIIIESPMREHPEFEIERWFCGCHRPCESELADIPEKLAQHRVQQLPESAAGCAQFPGKSDRSLCLFAQVSEEQETAMFVKPVPDSRTRRLF